MDRVTPWESGGGSRQIPFRVALLGAGGIAPEHAAALGNLHLVDLVAVCDLAAPRARDLAQRHGIPASYSGLDEMLAAARPDVVHVLTPPQTHVELASVCLKAGCHVLVEKPLGVSVAECRKLQVDADAAGRFVGVNHTAVFAPAFQQLVALIRSGRVGRVNHASVLFSTAAGSIPHRDPAQFMFQRPANMLFELGSHPFSLVRRVMGRPLKVRATADGVTAVRANLGFSHTWQASMACERGTAQLTLTVGRGAREISVTVLGEDAVARADLLRGSVALYENSPFKIYGGLVQSLANARESIRATLGPLTTRAMKVVKGKPDPAASWFYLALSAFYEAVAAGRRPPEGLEEGLAVVEYCESVASAALGG
jgi:predicted dehydrogenase